MTPVFWKFISELAPPKVTVPVALNVVNAPVDAVVAPMAVEFRPVEVIVAAAVLVGSVELLLDTTKSKLPFAIKLGAICQALAEALGETDL